jgi:hypothetical protein
VGRLFPHYYSIASTERAIEVPFLALSPTISGPVKHVILSVTSPVDRNSSATLSAQTAPSASCTIIVHYKSGPSKASGLGPKTADASGLVSWTWIVASATTARIWPIDVTCNGVTKSTTFTVR